MKGITIGIYKVTSPSGKVYIGQSWNLERRFIQYGAKHIKRQPKLYASIVKYGKEAHRFEIIHELPNDVGQDILDNYEQFYMDAYSNAGFDLMNVRGGGSRGKHSEESLKKMRGLLGQWMNGRKLSDETIKKRTEKQKGLKRSDVSKLKLRESKMGEKNPHYGKKPWNFGLKGWGAGRIASEETRRKIGDAHRGKVMSTEAKFKMSISRGHNPTVLGGSNPHAILNEEKVKSIRNAYVPHVKTMQMLADDYEVSLATIFGIIKRTTWKHI